MWGQIRPLRQVMLLIGEELIARSEKQALLDVILHFEMHLITHGI